MSSKHIRHLTFEIDQTIQPIYTGGDVDQDRDGQVLASCIGEDALLIDLNTGDVIARIEGDGEVLTTLRITPTASHVVACSRSLSMRIYALELPNGSDSYVLSLLKTAKAHTTPVISASIDYTGSILATGSADGVIKVWDIAGGYVSHTFHGHSGVISSLCFFDLAPELVVRQLPLKKRGKSRIGSANKTDSATNRTEPSIESTAPTPCLASGGEDGKIRVWSLVKRAAIASLESHTSVVRDLGYSPSQKALLSGSRDRTLILWDAKNWKVKRIIPILESIEACGFLEDGRLIYSGGEHGRLRLWETNSGRELTKEQKAGTAEEIIIDIIISPSTQSLLCIHGNRSLDFYSTDGLAATAEGELSNALPLVRRISGTHDEVIDLAYIGSNKDVMALATNEDYVKLVSTRKNVESSTINLSFGGDVGMLRGHNDIVICLDSDWSGCWLVTGAKDNSARLWQIDHSGGSYKCFATLTGHAESVGAVALPAQSPGPDSLAFKDPLNHPPKFLVTGSQDKTVKVWDIQSMSRKTQQNAVAMFTRKAHDKDINALDVNHDSTLFASASQDRTVKVWTIQDGRTRGTLKGHKRGVWSVKFAYKGTTNIFGDSTSGSASRGLVLTGSGDKTVKIWSLSDWSCLRTFEGHTNTVLKVLWLPPNLQDHPEPDKNTQSSAFVASAGGDGLVKVWDALDGECACTLDNHADRVWALATNTHTRHLVSGGGDGVVTFWVDTTAATAAASAAASTARVEQEQELANYVHRGNYREAIVLSLQLNHPARLFSLFKDVVERHPAEPGSLSGLTAVDDVLGQLGDEQLYTLLLRLRDWNTSARATHVAQKILWVLAKTYPASRLVGLRKRGRGLGEVLEALRVYTERHYKRCEELLEESYVVDFIVRGMGEGAFVSSSV